MNSSSILAIDDNPDNLVTLEALLSDGFPGMRILLAQSGLEGLRMALEADPDVILLDIVMPGLDGFDVCGRLKSDERLRHIPVLFLTAIQTSQESRIRALEMGAEGFLAKPIDEVELAAQIRAMLKIKAAHDATRLEKERLAGLVAERTSELVHELAERAQAEKALRQAHNELAAIHANVPVALVLVDRERRVLKINRAAEELAGATGETMLGARAGDALRCVNSFDDPRGCGFGAACETCAIRMVVVETLGDRQPREQVEVWRSFGTGLRSEPCCLLVATAYLELDSAPAVLLSALDITERKRAEQALRESEELYRSVITASPEDITIADLEGRILMVSPAALTIFGYRNAEDLIGRTLGDSLVPEERDRAKAYVEQMRAGLSTGPAEYRAVRRDGARITIEVNGEFVRDAVGQPTRMIFVVRDITSRKKSEEVLTFLARSVGASTDVGFFRSLVEFLSETLELEFVCVSRLDAAQPVARTVAVWFDGELQANEVYALAGTPCGELAGRDVWIIPAQVCELFPGDTMIRDLGMESYAGATLWSHTGEPAGLLSVMSRRGVTNRSLLETVLRMVAVRAGGELDRMDAEEALREKDQRFQILFDRATDGVFLMSLDGKLEMVNQSFANMHGYSVDEMRGMRLEDLDPDRAQQVPLLMRRLLDGEALSFEVEHYHKNGHLFPLEVSASLIDVGGTAFIQCFHRDITEHKKAEVEKERLKAQLTQAQKMESIGRLAGGVAHDFNNLLTVINGYSQLLLEDRRLDEKNQSTLAEILKAGERAAGLTAQLLAYSRKQVLQLRPLNLNNLVQEMRSMLQRLVGEDVEVLVALKASAGMVQADPHQLDQVVMNLAVNAKDAMPRGGKLMIETANVELDEDYVGTHPGAPLGRCVMLAVSDTGVGMEKETQRNIFEPFFTTKGMGKGTGLGLSMVQGIVAQSGGHIEVYSEPGHGTTFKIYLPALTEVAADTGQVAAPPVLRGHETVLVVEDQCEVLQYTVAALSAYGYRVLKAENRVEALQAFEQERGCIDIVLTDVIMPNGSGRELANELEKLQPGIRVLFMSGYTDDAIAHQGVLAEGAEFLQKPFSPQQLATKVRMVLGYE